MGRRAWGGRRWTSGAPAPADASALRVALRGLLAGIAIALLLKYGGRLSGQVERLDGWIDSLGWAAPAVFVAVVALGLPLFLPATVLKAAAGALFHPLLGVALYLAGQYGAALLMYVLGRRWLAGPVRERVEREPRLALLRNAAETGTATRQFLVRMTPLSFALVCYALSALGVALRPYLIGCLAAVPSTFVTVWFASAAHHAAVAADDPETAAHPELWTALTIAAAALLVLALLSRWLRPQLAAMAEPRGDARRS